MKLKNNKYEKLKKESLAMNDSNCCSVIAVAVALNCDYKSAYGMCAKAGRKHNRGMYTFQILKALEIAGKKLTKLNVNDILSEVDRPNYRVKTLTNNNFKMSETYKQGTYLILNNNHVATVKNGVTHDWSVNKAKKVMAVWSL